MKKRVILLVEDNDDDIMLAKRALRSMTSTVNISLVVAKDGVEALNYLFNIPKNTPDDLPSVIFLDINMPQLDGLETLAKLREHEDTSLIPVVMLTTSNEKKDRIRAYHYRANSYVLKPVDFHEFKDNIQALCNYWLGLNISPPTAAVTLPE